MLYVLWTKQILYCPIIIPGLSSLPQASVLPAQLAGYHSQPVGPAISPRILFGAGMHSLPANSTLSTSQPPTSVSRAGRSPEALRQASHSLCSAMPRTVPKQALPGLQERWFLPSSGQLNQFMTKCHFKMEGINMLKDLLSNHQFYPESQQSFGFGSEVLRGWIFTIALIPVEDEVSPTVS